MTKLSKLFATPAATTQAAAAGVGMTPQERVAATSNEFLRRFVDIWILSAIVLFIVFGMIDTTLLVRAYSLFVMLSTGLLARMALRAGRMQMARCLIVLPLSIATLVLPLYVNGLRTPIIVSLPMLVLLAGWLLGRRTMVLLTVASLIAVTLYWLCELKGWYVIPIPLRPIGVWWLASAFIIAFTGISVWYLLGNYEAIHQHETELRRELDVANAALADQLMVRTDQLQHADESLAQVRTDYEKAYPLAMMAAIVPAVAHDLNTPVGNTGMATSTLRDHLREFQRMVAGGALRRSELDAFIHSMSEGLHIIETANARAGDLVGNLKELSIDQATQRRRSFAVDKLIDEVMVTLAPSLRTMTVKVVRNIDTDLQMDSYPGPLGQVLANLVQNTLVHGFEGRTHGTVTLRGKLLDDGQVRLTVEDDGVGMNEEVRRRLFEPFFTTKLGRGGSGIGLAFSRKLVEATLGGNITVESTLNVGSRFIIDLPRVAPIAANPE